MKKLVIAIALLIIPAAAHGTEAKDSIGQIILIKHFDLAMRHRVISPKATQAVRPVKKPDEGDKATLESAKDAQAIRVAIAAL